MPSNADGIPKSDGRDDLIDGLSLGAICQLCMVHRFQGDWIEILVKFDMPTAGECRSFPKVGGRGLCFRLYVEY